MRLSDVLGWLDPAVAVNIALLGVLTAWFGTKVWPVIKRLVLLADKLERFEQLENDVATIKTEVTYNNGSSLKDAVRRVEQGQASQDAQLERLQLAVFHNGPTA